MKGGNQRLAAAFLTFVSATASAYPITTDVGAVTILGNSYNVSILYDSLGDYLSQSFNDLAPAINFFTESQATAAVIALDTTFPGFHWVPPINALQGTRVPFGFEGSSYKFMTVAFDQAPFGPFTHTLGEGNAFSFAQFTLLNEVAEPFSLSLLCVGLAGLGWSQRKR